MKLLLHTCCGPCASGCLPRLKAAGHDVTLFFSNANLDTPAEYERRLAAARKLAAAEGVPLIADTGDDHADWLRNVATGCEEEPEKGARCARCFRYSLSRTAAYAAAHGFEGFATSLTVSPHKVSEVVFASSDDPRFVREDFKKRGGFQTSLARSAELGLYRQDYCGCEFSHFAALCRKYDAYVDTFRGTDGKLPEMMELKLDHTRHVVENARLIARAEKFPPDLFAAALSAALLHDTGRYEQLRRYDTFRDSESVDHAVFSHDIVVGKGWTEDRGVLDAVLYHNRRDLPENLEPRTFALAHVVRDADKLDIFRVLEDRLEHTDWRHDTKAFWNLKVDASPNPAVVAAVEAGQPVDYQNIRSLADFILIQVGWIRSGLHFASTRRLCAERGHLEYRRRILKSIRSPRLSGRVCDRL